MNATQSLEAALETLARTRDPEAWELLVTLAGGDIFELSRQILRDSDLADDATQETLLRVRDSAGPFRGMGVPPMSKCDGLKGSRLPALFGALRVPIPCRRDVRHGRDAHATEQPRNFACPSFPILLVRA